MPRILVIDDSAFYRTYVRGFLEAAGFEVDDFLPASVLEIPARIRNFGPDLVFTDFNMPKVDGLAVARMVKRVDPDLPVVVLTALRDDAKDEALLGAGVVQILNKPAPGELIVEVARALLRPA